MLVLSTSRRASRQLSWTVTRRYLAVYAWGDGDNGQLGLPDASLDQEQETFGRSALTPRRLERLDKVPILQISSSAAHTAFVGKDGSLWTCGLGEDGQLGHGTLDSVPEPLKIDNIPPIKAVACGNRHTLALTNDGDIYAFGNNNHGQLGTESDAKTPYPIPVSALQNAGHEIVSVSAGDDFSAAASANGDVYTWGSATLGRLGHQSEASSLPSPIRFVLGDSTRCEHVPRLVRTIPARISAIYCGKHHAIAVSARGGAFAWGAGRHFQLGTGEEKDCATPVESMAQLGRDEILKVSAGGMHSLVLCRSGRVYAIGMNEAGCLGLGYQHASTRSCSFPVPVAGITNVHDVSAGWHVSAAVVGPVGEDGCGEVVTWGSGNAGALGTGDPVDHWEPVRVGIRARGVVVGSAGAHVLAFDGK